MDESVKLDVNLNGVRAVEEISMQKSNFALSCLKHKKATVDYRIPSELLKKCDREVLEGNSG